MKRTLGLVALLALGCGGETPMMMTPDGGSLSGVGGVCAADVDCRSGLTCFLGADGARPWPSGYCTRPCSMEDCPTGSRCGEAYTDAAGDTVYMCLTSCTRMAGSAGGCRAGYQCMYDGACHVGCSSDAECESVDFDQGPPVSHPGSTCELASARCIRGTATGADSTATCTSDADCRGPSGVCIGGSCYRGNCDLGGAYVCSPGQQCYAARASDFQVSTLCGVECTVGVDAIPGAPGVCRANEQCLPQESDLLDHATHAYCFPSHAPVAGSSTAHYGDPCTSESQCPNEYGLTVCSDGICQQPYCAAPSIASLDICGAGADCIAIDTSDVPDRIVRHSGPLGYCFRTCVDSTECAGGFTCNSGHCTP